MNAIYLWACYMSRPGPLGEHESLYLSRALAARQDALPNPSRVIDLIQAQCILSIYFLSNGRILEGSYHASSAASLAVQWGLHQTGAPDVTPGSMLCDWDLSSFRLEPPVDALEQGERIRTFWQVYDLDRCWSVVLGRPSIIPDSKHPRSTITTPWPQRMEEYEAVSTSPLFRLNSFSHRIDLRAGSTSVAAPRSSPRSLSIKHRPASWADFHCRPAREGVCAVRGLPEAVVELEPKCVRRLPPRWL